MVGLHHSNHAALGQPWLPLSCPCALLLRNIVEQSHSSNGWPSVYTVWGPLDLVGVCLHKLQFTPESPIASQVRELCQNGIFETPKAGMCIRIYCYG